MAMNIILWFLLTSDGWLRKKRLLPREIHFPLSDAGFLCPDLKDRPWKYQDLADAMRVIHAEDECNDTYGRIRMYQALLLKNPTGIKIPSERTVYRVMDEIGLVHRPKRKPNGITKADREARKSDDLLKRELRLISHLKNA